MVSNDSLSWRKIWNGKFVGTLNFRLWKIVHSSYHICCRCNKGVIWKCWFLLIIYADVNELEIMLGKEFDTKDLRIVKVIHNDKVLFNKIWYLLGTIIMAKFFECLMRLKVSNKILYLNGSHTSLILKK